VFLAIAFGLSLLPLTAQAQAKRKGPPSSKIYVSDVSGEAMIDTGEAVEDLSKRSVHTAQGAVIETTKPQNEQDRSKYFSTMVYSNGTGTFFDADTRVEMRRFVQEPFTPNRTDIDIEPSISQTHAFVARGAVGLCTSKLIAGSNMVYETRHGAVTIRGRKLVIETTGEYTKISMVEGDGTVRAGARDMGGHTVRAGEQAIIRPGAAGQPNTIEIVRIPQSEQPQIDERVSLACMAKRTVYFETRAVADGEGVTAFDGDANGPAQTAAEIVPVEIVPTNLPVEFTVSPATILPPGAGTGG
jgi:hypothetical protein